MKTIAPAVLGRSLLACVLAATALALKLPAQTPAPPPPPPAEPLEPVVVTATRTAEPVTQVGADIATLDAAELAQFQITTPRAALGLLAGAPMAASGTPGSVDSLFLRGANSNQTLFLVDGIRLNDANTDYQLWLGGASLGANDRLELLRGSQGTLYGADAIGGVVSLTAQRGAGSPTASVGAEAGSFGALDGNFAAQGASGPWSYNVSADTGHTNNDRPNNEFTTDDAVVRIDRTLSDQASVGGTLRWFNGSGGTPGDIFTNDPVASNTENNVLETVFLEVTPTPDWSGKLTLGGQERRYVADTPPPDAGPAVTTTVNTRAVVDAQLTYDGFAANRLTFGTTDEADHTTNDGFGSINNHQTVLAAFAEDEFSPVKGLILTGGLRNDDYSTFGDVTTGRATAAWLVLPGTLKLRASYGTGFRAPSFLELYGTSAAYDYQGNPNLRPETSHGGDAGVDYYLPDKRGTLSATWFQTDYRDLIEGDYNVDPNTEVNVDRARMQGLEFEARLVPAAGTELRLAYTYLDAQDFDPANPLVRRPRDSGSADLWHNFGDGVSGSVGLAGEAQRQDYDAQTFALVNDQDFLIAHVHAAWQVNPHLTLKARVENLFNKKYEDVNGYPALGFGAYFGAEWKF
jgi:vitamin B12 transporter